MPTVCPATVTALLSALQSLRPQPSQTLQMTSTNLSVSQWKSPVSKVSAEDLSRPHVLRAQDAPATPRPSGDNRWLRRLTGCTVYPQSSSSTTDALHLPKAVFFQTTVISSHAANDAVKCRLLKRQIFFPWPFF